MDAHNIGVKFGNVDVNGDAYQGQGKGGRSVGQFTGNGNALLRRFSFLLLLHEMYPIRKVFLK